MEINNGMALSTENGNHCEKCTSSSSVSELRNSASQCLATLAVNVVMFCSGAFFGLTTILIPVLKDDMSEIHMSFSEITWFSSYLFLQPIGAILVGLVSRWLGSRLTLLLGSLFFISSLLMFYNATSSRMFLVAQGIAALSNVGGPGITYATEITQPHLRSVIMATTNFSSILGALFITIMASFLYWTDVVLATLIFAILGFIALFFIPNSPYWLATKGRLREAELALAWLRGWTTVIEVKSEFKTLTESIPPSHRPTPAEKNNSILSLRKRVRNNIKLYLQRSFLLPMFSICYIFIVRAAMGTLAVEIFSEHIFNAINTPHQDIFTIAVFSVDILGSLFYMMNVNRFGKKTLMFISLIEAGVSYLFISILVYLTTKKYLTDQIYLWIAPSVILFSIFATTSGVDTIVNVLTGELFPTRFRDIGAGIGMFMNTASASVMQKIFLYLEKYLTISGVFLFFSFMTFVGLITFYFIIPETEGKTLLEIEHHYTNFSITRSFRKKNKLANDAKSDKSEVEDPMLP